MSEFPETRALFSKTVSPQAMVGVASPLWGLFAGAAASGVAWWWMTRWARPENLEALFGASASTVGALPEAVAQEALAGDFPQTVVGGEGAPFGVVMEAVVEAEAEAEPVIESAARAVEAVTEAVSEPPSDPEPAPEPKTGPVPEPALAAAVAPTPEAKPDPKPEPVAEAAPAPKPRPKAPAEPRSVAPKSVPAATPKAD